MKILPCPFCGSKDIGLEYEGVFCKISCDSCFATSPEKTIDYESEIVEMWNLVSNKTLKSSKDNNKEN